MKKHNRFREITGILLKHQVQKDRSPQNIKATVEELGPTYIKIAQILSTREDMIPKAYCDEFAKLKENAVPLPFGIVTETVNKELGRDYREIFSEIEEIPLGSASIGQVHKAKLLDGTDVVVKVMRPGIYEKVVQDFALLKKSLKYCNLFSVLDDYMSINTILDETFENMKLEMDFINELNNIELFRENNKEFKYIKLPKTYPEYSTSEILVMEYIHGVRIDDVKTLTERGYDLKEICSKLVENFIAQVIDHGAFHADPHNGNVMIEEGKIVWLDLGMIGKMTQKDKILYKRIIRAILKSDVYELKNVVLTMGICRDEINHAVLYQDIEKMLFKISNTDVADIDMGEILEDLMGIARHNGISLPRGLTMLARSVVIIQKVIAALEPKTSLLQFLSSQAMDRYKEDFDLAKYAVTTAQTVVKGFGKATDLPVQIADLLDITIKGQKHSNIEIVNLRENVDKFNKMTNRLIIGIGISSLALILGFILGILVYKIEESWIIVAGFVVAGLLCLAIVVLTVVLTVMMIKDSKKHLHW